jgi:NitT/TauT family transport system substrate-binding protein
MFKKLFLFFLVLLILISAALFYSRSFSRLTTVYVHPKWVNQAQFAGMFSAKEKGLYRNEGLNVVFEEFEPGNKPVEKLVDGSISFAITSAEELLLARDAGAKVKAVAAIYQISPYALVSLKEEDITFPSDFRGKTLALKGNKIEEKILYQILLGSVGLSDKDVSMNNLGFKYLEHEDLVSGRADVVNLYRTDQVYFFEKEGIDYNIIYPEKFGSSILNDIIVAREDLIESNPEIVRDFVSATIKGWEYSLSNKEKSVEHTLKYVTKDSYKDAEYQMFILEKSENLIKPNVGERIGSMTHEEWNDLYLTMVEQGFVKEGLDVSEVFTMEFVY